MLAGCFRMADRVLPPLPSAICFLLTNSDETQKKAQRYEELYGRTDLSDEQRAERAALRIELKDAKEVLEKIEGKKVS